MTPTARTLRRLRELGFTAAVVERRIPGRFITIDLFGVADIVAMYPGFGILLVQTTSGANHAARRNKAMAEPRLQTWLECGGRFELWSWAKQGERGRRKLWTLRREEIAGDGCVDVDTTLEIHWENGVVSTSTPGDRNEMGML